MTSEQPLSVVMAPKTRLGRELIARAMRRDESIVAMARHEADVTALADSGAEVVLAGQSMDRGRPLQVFVCALGPVHPIEGEQPVDLAADSAAVDRDLRIIEDLLASRPGAHVVLVSTVIALAPRPDRRYYGGWRGVVERQLRDLAHRHGAEISVLYPGRLIDGNDIKHLRERAYTRYDKLADLAERAAVRPPSSRLVGLDARVWGIVRGLILMFGSLRGSAGTPTELPTTAGNPQSIRQESPR